MTRRLFNTSSVSVRKKKVAISSMHFAAGNPTLVPQALRKTRMNSAFGNGFGDARITTPSKFSRVISQ